MAISHSRPATTTSITQRDFKRDTIHRRAQNTTRFQGAARSGPGGFKPMVVQNGLLKSTVATLAQLLGVGPKLSPETNPTSKFPAYTLFASSMDEYFATTKFNMNKAQQQTLRSSMNIVYLRKLPLVSFDVEAWEVDNNLVTEIGLAIYDPRGQELSILPDIKLAHFIIKEHQNKFNGKYVPDNKHNFVGGTSHVLPEQAVRDLLNRVIRYYFHDADPACPAALVGHLIDADIKWLKKLGVNFPQDPLVVDTNKIYLLSHGKLGGGLRQILRIVNIPHAYLHNAANDAYYTLKAALAWCDPLTRRSHGIDKNVIDNTPCLDRSRQQINEDKRLKRQEKFTDLARMVE